MCHTSTFAKRINAFNASLKYSGKLPEGISVMNPFRENSCATPASRAFYDKYYNDNDKRLAILGINPGRFGAGITGVPFTDPVRLAEACDIHIAACPAAREPSSVFVYEIINKFGGVEKFYSLFYINSLCPLGFTRQNEAGRQVNFNYYDSRELEKTISPFIVATLKRQIGLGLVTTVCFCFGKGKNYNYFNKLNKEYEFFEKIVPLDHPRFIMQYKSKDMEKIAQEYADIFKDAM